MAGHDPRPEDSAFGRSLRAYLAASRWLVAATAVLIFAGMVAVNSLEIVGRGFFGTSFGWVQEISILGAMWIYFFAYALIAKNDEYIRVEFLTSRLRHSWRRAIEVFARLATLIFHLTIAWFALETFRFLGLFTTSVLGLSEALFVLPILLGAIDIVITEAIHLYMQVSGQEPPRRSLPPAGVD